MENEMKSVLLLALLLALLVGNLIFLSSYSLITGNAATEQLSEKYSYTKAICEKNVCQDYEIACNNGILVYKFPVTEKVYFSKDWKDSRDKEAINKSC
jgi:hypothetical protein